MASDTFRFKQFCIQQRHAPFKVGTDSILLGAWTETASARKILDIGTGTGLLALMLAQRTTASIQAIEFNEEAAQNAAFNFEHSPWKDRLQLIRADVNAHFANKSEVFDRIISNPPYFLNSVPANNQNVRAARHADSSGHRFLIDRAIQLLSRNGHLSIILPTAEGEQFSKLAIKEGLSLQRKTVVRTRPDLPSKRLLLQFGKQPTPQIEYELSIMQKEGSEYSSEYLKLTDEFYL